MRSIFNLKFDFGAHACAYAWAYPFTNACAHACAHPCNLIVYR